MDRAGNNSLDAHSFRKLTAQAQIFSGNINRRNRLDLYRFKVVRRSSLYVALSQLTAHANIDLMSQTGQLLARSKSRATSETFLQTLEAGIYDLKVHPGKSKTQYQLRLAATKTAKLPVPSGNALPGDRWLYQLQDASIPAINATAFNLLTIDYSQDGSDRRRYTPADLQSLHNAGKNVLGYLSIGEAEDYRYYFQPNWVKADSATGLKQPVPGSAPAWLDRTNPDWQGNYKVKYWSKAWQTIVLNYLDRIINAGFDGVYLDIIDGFEYWSDQSQLKASGSQSQKLKEPDAARRMIKFVERIAYHARVIRGQTNFQIVPQNGEAILDYDQGNRYLRIINGVGVEDLFYNGRKRQSSADVKDRVRYLNQVQRNGKTVLSIDYVDDGTGHTGANGARINNFLKQAQKYGYLPYVGRSDRDLNEINKQATV